MADFSKGDLILSGTEIFRLQEREEKNPLWKSPGWRVYICPYTFGDRCNMTTFVPDYLLNSARLLPQEWTPVVGGGLEERYVWSDPYLGRSRWFRELRKLKPASQEIEGETCQ